MTLENALRILKPEDVSVEREGKYWVVVLPGYTPKTIRIAQTDGRIR